MKQYKLFKLGLFALALCLSLPLFMSCGSDDDEKFVEGDTTDLKAELAICYDSLQNASPEFYTLAVTDRLKKKSDLLTEILSKPVSAQEVINLTINIVAERDLFINSRMEGIPAAALIAGWNFDEEDETSITSEGVNNLEAFLTPGPSAIFPTTSKPTFVEGGIGKAMHFKNGGHLEIPTYNPSNFLGKELTIALWVKPDVIKNGNYIASLNYWNNWKFEIQSQGKPFFTVKTGAGHTDADNEADLSASAGKWKHIIMVLNLSNQKLSFYVNGQLAKEWTNTQKPNLVGSQDPAYTGASGGMLPLMIGASTTYEEAKAAWNWSGWESPEGWSYFEGMMDEFKFYNIAISPGQVQWLYNKEAVNLSE